MTPAVPPTAEEQIQFLQNVRKLLSEGGFVASYKFALLHALADLSVIDGDDSGGALVLPTRKIAEEFVALYWRQARPFPSTIVEPTILQQNKGRQAKIVSQIGTIQSEFGPVISRFRQSGSHWERLLRDVDRVVQQMPLWKLQTTGQGKLEFLYNNCDGFGHVDSIRLLPGVAYCFRAFYDLITDLIRGSWLRFIRRTNQHILGEASDLGSFLFGTERAPLKVYDSILAEIQDGRCFYCDGRLGARREVDHFIPWSRFPVDLGHNFVLVDSICNRYKSDHLAAENHLERWLIRNEEHARGLVESFDRLQIVHDIRTSLNIAQWAYRQAEYAQASVWAHGNSLAPLNAQWRSHFN